MTISSATSAFRGLLRGDLNRYALPGFRSFSDKLPFRFRFREHQNQVRTGQVQGANAACLSPGHHNQHGPFSNPISWAANDQDRFSPSFSRKSNAVLHTPATRKLSN